MPTILPVYSHSQLEQNVKVLAAAYQAGLRRFEYTNRFDNSLQTFKHLVKLVNDEMPDMQIGAGTIINVKDATLFMDEGAQFLVSPLISQELIDYTTHHKIEWIPGCATGAEIGMAQNANIPLVKLYPISTLGGPEFIRLIRGPFYKIKFQASGGIKGEIHELKALFDAGASVVGLGNSYFKESATKEELVHSLTTLIGQL